MEKEKGKDECIISLCKELKSLGISYEEAKNSAILRAIVCESKWDWLQLEISQVNRFNLESLKIIM
jgi:hypothetical protein